MTVPAPVPVTAEVTVARLERRLKRENQARLEAEAIAERGLRDLYQRQQEIALLEAIAVAANEAGSIDEAMALAIQQICRYTQWQVGHVFYAPEDAAGAPDVLQSTDLWHLNDGIRIDAFQEATAACQLSRGVGMPGRIWATGNAEWIYDVTVEPRFLRRESAAKSGIKAGFGFPVLIQSEVVAILEFFSLKVLEPDESLMRLMRQLGTQLGRVVERSRASSRLKHHAFHDTLTQLANRNLFLERLSSLFERASRDPDYRFAVLFLDLDRFKLVNDSMGHLAGDQLIVGVARRLTACLRHSDLVGRPVESDAASVARLGGDEFTLLLYDVRDDNDPIRVAERLQRALAEPFMVFGQTIYTTASIGIARSSAGYKAVEDMLRDADAAMYRAKEAGRAGWAIFDQAMHQQAMRNLQLEADLHRAFREEQFQLCYQPIVQLPDGRVSGFEALLRWRHPVHGMVSPAEFIPLAEVNGLIRRIGRWVLEQACRQVAQWQREYPMQPPVTISVNVSGGQLGQPELVDQVADIVRSSGLLPGTLKLELTESVVMDDAERTRKLFLSLKALGIQLSLDDFGTGYSSLSYLRRLPIDNLKVDRSFVSNLDTDEEKRQITEIIVTLARTLGLTVIAEGAETQAEVDHLNLLQCDYAQGYFFYRPLYADAAGALLAHCLHLAE